MIDDIHFLAISSLQAVINSSLSNYLCHIGRQYFTPNGQTDSQARKYDMIAMIVPLWFLLWLGCCLPFSSNGASHDFSFDVLTATATDLKSWQEEGKLSSKQIVERYLAQIEANNDYLHAVISTAPRRKIILRAIVLDIKRLVGLPLKPLHGIPVLIKVGSTCFSQRLPAPPPKFKSFKL